MNDLDYAEEAPEMLATRRSRRSTAGNRMATVMAEVALDETLKDFDDDKEFVNAIDEQDVFGSDFESTDEEAERQIEQAGEAEATQEEKLIRKAIRSRLEKATAAAHAKHRVTFNPDIQVSAVPSPKAKSKANRNQLETGTTSSPSLRKSELSKTRTSKRMHTVLNTTATVTRLKESEQKKAAQPRKVKAESRTYTQGELIALALDTEEGNIREHRDYLKNEEEKRKRARVVRTTIEGPKLRWVSRTEKVKVPMPPPLITPQATAGASSSVLTSYRSVYGPPGTLFTPTTYTYASGSLVKTSIMTPSTTSSQAQATTPNFTLSHYSPYSPYQYQPSPFPVWPPTHQQSYYPTISTTTTPPTSTLPSSVEPLATSSIPTTSLPIQTNQLPSDQQPTSSEPEYKTEPTTKNYLVHELAQHKGTPKPTWGDNMKAMFGDHVKWEELKVFVGKNRPYSRPRQNCPITGLPANYLDPRTGVPYADVHSYKVLGQLLKQEYVWNPSTGSYLGTDINGGEEASGSIDRMDSN